MTSSLVLAIFESVLVAMVLTIAAGLLSIWLVQRLNFYDIPGSAPHKQHTVPTPLAGGVTLVIALGALVAVYQLAGLKEHRAIFLSGSLVFLAGLLDDLRDLPPWLKLLLQSAAVAILIRQGLAIRIFESPGFFVHGESSLYVWLDVLITLLWMVGITNAFNFVDSMDGLAAALAATAAAFFSLVTLDSNQAELSRFSALLLGACIGLYYFNSPPARLFLGDAGAQTLGFLLGALAIAYHPRGTLQTSSWFAPVLILGVPIFDMALVVFSRLRRGKPVYQSALDHTYHRLVRLGIEPTRAVLTMHVAALLLGCLAFLALNLPPLFANGIFALVLASALGALVILEGVELQAKSTVD